MAIILVVAFVHKTKCWIFFTDLHSSITYILFYVAGNSTICDMERKFICVPSQLGEFPLYFDCYAGKCDNFVRSIENSSCHTSSTTDHAHSTREGNVFSGVYLFMESRFPIP